jgi:hypothetical protein
MNFNDERNIKELGEGEESPLKASWKIFTKQKQKVPHPKEESLFNM